VVWYSSSSLCYFENYKLIVILISPLSASEILQNIIMFYSIFALLSFSTLVYAGPTCGFPVDRVTKGTVQLIASGVNQSQIGMDQLRLRSYTYSGENDEYYEPSNEASVSNVFEIWDGIKFKLR
jgi:hypothetical protein